MEDKHLKMRTLKRQLIRRLSSGGQANMYVHRLDTVINNQI
jgi:hypothetical protein